MILHVSTAGLTLAEPRDLKSYKVVIDGPAAAHDALIAAAPGLRRMDASHVALAETALKDLAGEVAADQDWLTGFAGMIAYARSKGWVTEAGEIVGHIE
jgi:hypothetical protein